jgi:hypothetical protein
MSNMRYCISLYHQLLARGAKWYTSELLSDNSPMTNGEIKALTLYKCITLTVTDMSAIKATYSRYVCFTYFFNIQPDSRTDSSQNRFGLKSMHSIIRQTLGS